MLIYDWSETIIKKINLSFGKKKLNKFLFSSKFLLLEIGPGWKATILNSATKFYIVLANMKGQGMVTDFYIGGSTDAADLTDDLGSGDDAVESGFEDYLPDSTGTYEITYY